MSPTAALAAVATLVALAAAGQEPPRSVSFLLVDLDGDGVYLSDIFYPVRFDTDGDGSLEWVTWTARNGNDGFLWLDANRNGIVDDGRELLLGLPAEAHHWLAETSLFQQLATLETPGRPSDGVLSPSDPVWRRLGVWVDRNHDGRSSIGEVAGLDELRVAEIALGYSPAETTDGSLNRMKAVSSVQRVELGADGRPATRQRQLFEVEFIIISGRP